MRKIKFGACAFMVFIAGFAAALNFATIVEANKHYVGSWSEVAFGFVIASVFSGWAWVVVRGE